MNYRITRTADDRRFASTPHSDCALDVALGLSMLHRQVEFSVWSEYLFPSVRIYRIQDGRITERLP